MGAPKNRGNWLLILLATASAWALASLVLSESTTTAQSPPVPNSGVFTTAHPSVGAAVRDFFGWRPAPVQPVAFSHVAHAEKGLTCELCHTGAATGPVAVIPSTRFCMACHMVIAADHPEVQKTAAYVQRGEEVPWQRVYGYSASAHVRFNHAPHIRAEVPCATCHGDVAQQTVAERVVDMNMGFCLDCHRERQASTDCIACHF